MTNPKLHMPTEIDGLSAVIERETGLGTINALVDFQAVCHALEVSAENEWEIETKMAIRVARLFASRRKNQVYALEVAKTEGGK